MNKLIELCLICMIVLTPLAYGTVLPWSVAIFEVTTALMFLVWIFKMLANGWFEFVRVPVNGFILLFVFYVCLQLLSPISSLPGSIYHWATKMELLKIISYTLIFFVVLNTIRTKQQIMRILAAIVIVGFLMSVFYLMHYFGAKVPRGIINPDHFSGYLGMIIPLSLGILFVQPATADERKTIDDKWVLLFFIVIVMSVALFLTMSRGGMFSFIAALLSMAGLTLTRKSLRKKKWILSMAVILIVLTIAWLGATPVIERILSIKVEIASRYFGGRLPIWQGTLNIIKDYPLFGTGLGTFNYIFPKYQPAQIITKHYTYAHSDFLELLSEVGIAGFGIFLLGLLTFAIYAVTRFFKRHDPYVVGMSIGIFGSLASIFVHSFADFNLHIPANAILLTIILALFIVVLNYKKDDIFLYKTIRYPLSAMRYPLYILVLLLAVVFISICARPVMANHYARSPAVAGLKEATILDPANASYHYQLGKLYIKDTKTKRTEMEAAESITLAIIEHLKATRLNPTNSRYQQSLAWIYGSIINSKTGRQNDLLARLIHNKFRLAIDLEPNNPYRHRAYAIWLFNNPTEENIEEGIAEYKKAITLNSDLYDEALEQYSRFTDQHKELLIDFLKDWVEREPGNADAQFTLADKTASRIHYEKAIDLKPDNTSYRYWYAVYLFRNKKFKEADEQFKRVVELNPKYSDKIKIFKDSGGREAER